MKKLIQYQKPMANMLIALMPITLWAIYNFGWRALALVAICNLCCFLGEYAFTSREGKPVSMATFVTGTLLALVCPPTLPFFYAAAGSFFAIVFGKMVFGGFGRNIFNPALVGRCFLYITFAQTMTSVWVAPIDDTIYGGFAAWENPPRQEEADPQTGEPRTVPANQPEIFQMPPTPGVDVDTVTSATVLTGTKKLNQTMRQTRAVMEGRAERPAYDVQEAFQASRKAVKSVGIGRIFLGRISGSTGETGSLLILLALAFLIWRKTVNTALVVAPVIGMVATATVFRIAGLVEVPWENAIGINLFGGGTMFAVVFMTTEPVSAPMKPRARWIYGLLIGFLGVVIRTLSAFNAGLMFAILLGNAFGPIIEIASDGYDKWRKERDARPREGTS